MKSSKILFIGCVSVMIAVILGAFGAHGLKKILEPDLLVTFKTGVTYQFYHGFGLIALALINQTFNINVKQSAILFILGIFLFSGNCYLYALTQIKAIAMIIPLGGLSFIIGWFILTIKTLKKRV